MKTIDRFLRAQQAQPSEWNRDAAEVVLQQVRNILEPLKFSDIDIVGSMAERGRSENDLDIVVSGFPAHYATTSLTFDGFENFWRRTKSLLVAGLGARLDDDTYDPNLTFPTRLIFPDDRLLEIWWQY